MDESQKANATFNEVDNSSTSLLITNKTGKVQYANQTLANEANLDAPQIIGMNPGDMWGGNMPRSFYKRMWHIIKSKANAFQGEVLNHYKTASKHKTISIVPLSEKNKKPSLFAQIEIPNGTLTNEQLESLTKKNYTNPKKAIAEFAELLKISKYTPEDSLYVWIQKNLIYPVNQTLQKRISDKELIIEAQKDPQQFYKLYEKYHDSIEKYFSHRISDTHHAYDLAQEVFIRAYKHLSKFRISNASYKTYLQRIAHNLLVNYYRDKKDIAEIPDSISTGNDMKKIHMSQEVRNALEMLTETEQKIIQYKYFEDYKGREIADMIGKTENAVKLHLTRARKKLRTKKQLKELLTE